MQQFLSGIANLLFPPKCAICGTATEKGGFCDNCQAQVSFIASPMCPNAVCLTLLRKASTIYARTA